MSFPASKTSWKKVKKNRGSTVRSAKPQMTSLIDIMTILLVFLLKSFSSEGEIITPATGLTLPESTAKKRPELALRIAITRNHLLVEGERIVGIKTMMKREGLVIPELEALLEDRRATTEKIAESSTSVEFKGDVLIEADRKVRYRILQKIMYTCGQIGFSNFSLLVIKKET